MDYNQSIAFLENELIVGTKPSLKRMTALMEELGNPQEKLNIIHVTGTNGKGSTVAMLSSILRAGGYRVGSYISPHLIKYNERISVNHEDISNEEFAKRITQVSLVVRKLQKENGPVPTLFEVITAAAFLYFAEQAVDMIVSEVGLGGRFDATNIIKKPLLSMIMSISLEHTHFLGNTIEEITEEKGGIIKKSCPVVLYSQEEIVYNIIDRIARSLDAPLFCGEGTIVEILSQDLSGSVFTIRNNLIFYESLNLPLLGKHQIKNCIAVLEACKVLNDIGIELNEKQIREGLALTKWPARLEVVKHSPYVLLDGAHNPDGMRALSNFISAYFPKNKVTLLLGVLAEKDYQSMMQSILPNVSKIVVTEPLSARKCKASSLVSLISNEEITYYERENLFDAYETALAITSIDDPIICCGSLYLVGALKEHIK